jgi:hypothetical protein
MTQAPQFITTMLGWPIPGLALIVLLFWSLIACLVHRILVPWIAGPDGRKLGKMEAEVASQLGIVLGLLLSFNAVTVWEQSGAARDATLAEASALRSVADIAPDLPPGQRDDMRAALDAYVRYVVDVEWPTLRGAGVDIVKPPQLLALARLGRSIGQEDLHDAIGAAVKAREDRLRIAAARMLPARWGIVIFLGILTLLAMGLLHAEHRRARLVSVSMITFAIASCFIVLMAQARPFLGALAIEPTELRALDTELQTAR